MVALLSNVLFQMYTKKECHPQCVWFRGFNWSDLF